MNTRTIGTTDAITPERVAQAAAKIAALDPKLSRDFLELFKDDLNSGLNNFPIMPNHREPGKTVGNQQNEPVHNRGTTGAQTAPNPPHPGNNPPFPGKTGEIWRSKRSRYEPNHGPRGFLNDLPEETQERIIDMLDDMTYREVIVALAQPAPCGIGKTVTKRSLERFYLRHRLSRMREDAASVAGQLDEFLNNPTTSDEQFTKAATRVLRSRLFGISCKALTFENINTVANLIDKIRRTDLAERKLRSADFQSAVSPASSRQAPECPSASNSPKAAPSGITPPSVNETLEEQTPVERSSTIITATPKS